MRAIALVVGQQAAWWSAALGAAAGRPELGLAVTAVHLAVALGLARDRRAELSLLLAAAAVGLAGDGALIRLGLVSIPEAARQGPLPSPVWLILLWPAFASLFAGPLAWVGRDLRVAAVAGAVAGPLAYRAGEGLGALELHGAGALLGLSLLYALAVPLLACWSRPPGERPLDRLLDATIAFSFDRTGYRRHALAFRPGDLDVRLDGQVFLITGANSGIGFATAEALAARGATVRLLCRDEGRGREALEKIAAATGSRALHLDLLDVSDLDAVRRYAAGLGEERIAGLVHNAGVLPAERKLASGLELTFATHVAGPWLLGALLQPKLVAGAARVVFVSSGGMYGARLSLDDLDWSRRPYDGTTAYAQTKRMQVVLAEELGARLAGTGVVVHAMHPGWVDTTALRTSLPRFWRLTRRILRTPEQGADTVIWLCAAEEPARTTGLFWLDRRPRRTHLVPWTRESGEDRARLVAACEALSSA